MTTNKGKYLNAVIITLVPALTFLVLKLTGVISWPWAIVVLLMFAPLFYTIVIFLLVIVIGAVLILLTKN